MAQGSKTRRQSNTRQQNNTLDVEKIIAALRGGDLSVATLFVAHQIKHKRVATGASIATVTDEIYSACARAYEQAYHDRQGFEAMWDDVEDGLRRIFD